MGKARAIAQHGAQSLEYEMNSTRRLRTANRMCLLLQRELGVTVDVARVLRHRGEAAEVLFACRGLDKPELVALADQFEADTAAEEAARLAAIAARTPGATAHELGWTQVTSGFGLSRPLSRFDDEDSAAPAPRAGWLERLLGKRAAVAH